MSRSIGSALQGHLDESSTTTCRLLKFTLKSGVVFGITSLDRDVIYDDGVSAPSGPVTYVGTNGFDPSTISADLGYSVSNAEGYALISGAIAGVTPEMVRAGEFDDATWVCYLVNFEDLTMGHVILDAGDVGDIRMRYGMLWMPELLSYAMRLKQPIGGVWSITCRAVFGSSATAQTGCGISLTSLWVSGAVTAVGSETDRTFTINNLSVISPLPGRIQFLTGANAGREYAVETVSGHVISLIETTHYPVTIGDTYRIRPDCRKRYVEDCIGVWNNGPNFKGEPYIPVGDGQQSQTPGAQLPGGSSFTGS